MAVIEDRQNASTARIPARMASSAHRMHGQTQITEAAQLRADGPSPGRQSSHPQQHTESTGRGLSSLERAYREASSTGGLGQERLAHSVGRLWSSHTDIAAGGPPLSELPAVSEPGVSLASDPWCRKCITPGRDG